MIIINSLEKAEIGCALIDGRTSVALGNFDGIHVGHQVVLNAAINTARERGLKSVCCTFCNHPFNFILGRDENDPAGIKLICTEERKIAMLDEMGFDYLVNVPFDETMMTMRAQAFIDDVLIGVLNCAAVSVGFNYTFGARAEGRTEMLLEAGRCHGFDVSVHDPVTIDGMVVSSTLIRQTIAAGDMEKTSRYLGRDYAFDGIVAHGRKIGEKLGFPTANLTAPINRALPPNGVYFGRIELCGKTYRSISNIGTNPTVRNDARAGSVADGEQGETARAENSCVVPGKTIETHIFDYEGDCYGEPICVYLEHFHRPEQKFETREALHEQIARDCEAARGFGELIR